MAGLIASARRAASRNLFFHQHSQVPTNTSLRSQSRDVGMIWHCYRIPHLADRDDRDGSTPMNWIALRMLTGDRSKYLGLIFGVTFATLLMTQQVSIFMGILTRTGNQILEIRDADIWVMDNRVRYIDEAPGLKDNDLMRVRGVPGVAWAVRSYKGIVRARLENGNTRNG